MIQILLFPAFISDMLIRTGEEEASEQQRAGGCVPDLRHRAGGAGHGLLHPRAIGARNLENRIRRAASRNGLDVNLSAQLGPIDHRGVLLRLFAVGGFAARL